ncbi:MULTISPECIES: hemolysin family protein [Anaerococcus]|uniref:Mg2+ and Co2+ transporter CorB n=1 Tax=Anaerococcus octavius TaxID=54007 RepID=A0A380WWP1_9FIRM|nr:MULTISPECIES: hemolysin family protein [Anaerococcus]MDU2599549.1 hemolysin family protein [Anaerococcus sp.]MDU3176774.1 hemolysin family protein [Anaerococcus sp.]SUU93203.1 Putative Mg2+ and Co2+ transporter CorB [Anaerococcus octavius]
MDQGPYHSLITILIIILFLIINGTFTAIHTGLITLNPMKLEEEKENDTKTRTILKIVSDQDRLNQSFDIINIILSLLTIAYISKRLSDISTDGFFFNGKLSLSWMTFIEIVLYSIIKVIFVDKIPQRIGVRFPMKITRYTVGLTMFVMFLTKPLVSITISVTNFFMNIFGIEAGTVEKEVTSEQIKSIFQVGENQGIIRPMESKMIHSIMGFDDLIAEEIMTARTDVFMIDVNDDQRTWLDEFTKIKHSRIPVYEDEVDNILGILYTKDYLLEATRVGIKNVHLKSLVKPAYFAPDKIETDKLFADMQIKHIHMAVLIDEYGGFAGVVTIDDLLEEIVGDLDDGVNLSSEFRENRKGVYVVKASMNIKDLNEKIPMDIDEENENFDSLGGFIIDSLGYIPEEGANETLIYNGYEIKILYIEDNRIKACRIRKLKDQQYANDNEILEESDN